jgi:multicomponent Na+:H+ antiporter subunit A
MVMLIGIGGEYGATAAVVFLLAHALYKAPLFMIAGSVDHEAGSRDVTAVRGLGRAMPFTWAAALLAGVSAAGLPPMFGFVAKELAYEALLNTRTWLLVPLVGASAVLLLIAVLVAWRPFAGRELVAPKTVHEAPPSMLVGPLVLAAAGVVFGFAPYLAGDALLSPAAAAVIGAPHSYDLYLWHGLTPALALSVLTVVIGVVLTWRWRSLHDALRAWVGDARFGPAGVYQRFIDGLVPFAEAFTRRVQPDDLRTHLTVIAAVAVAATGLTGLVKGSLSFDVAHEPGYFYEYLVMAVVVGAALAAMRAHRRLPAITALGVLGFGLAILFVFFAAPDLAITQFLVETLIVIIIALVLMRLPRHSLREDDNRAVRAVAGTIAALGGLVVMGLTLAVTAGPLDPRVSDFFAAESYPSALGRNIVNVILVDFRAIDTLGEITVLVVAAVGVYALLLRRDRRGDTGDLKPPRSGSVGSDGGDA